MGAPRGQSHGRGPGVFIGEHNGRGRAAYAVCRPLKARHLGRQGIIEARDVGKTVVDRGLAIQRGPGEGGVGGEDGVQGGEVAALHARIEDAEVVFDHFRDTEQMRWRLRARLCFCLCRRAGTQQDDGDDHYDGQ